MENKEYLLCKIEICHPEMYTWKSIVTGTVNNQLDLLEENRKKSTKVLKDNFYKIINKVVSLGGYYCPDSYTLKYEKHIIPKVITVKIPKKSYHELSSISHLIKKCSII